jgi:hypothetical protein
MEKVITAGKLRLKLLEIQKEHDLEPASEQQTKVCNLLSQLGSDIDKLEFDSTELAVRILMIIPYVISTLHSSNLPTYSNWINVSAGRAYSSNEQLKSLEEYTKRFVYSK